MTSAAHAQSQTRNRPVAGYVLTTLVVLFLSFDSVLKVLALAPAVQGTTQLGYPALSVVWIGLIQMVCLVLYLVPRTAVLGALLFTGYLGGAVALICSGARQSLNSR